LPRLARLTLLLGLLTRVPFGYGQATTQNVNSDAVPMRPQHPALGGWPKVILNVVVQGTKQLVAQDTASALQIMEDRTPQTLETISGPGSPVSLCVQIDISASMANRRNEIRDAASSLVENLPPGSEVMISVFAEKSYLPRPFTPAATIDLSFLDRLKFSHRTALNDSVTISEPYFVYFAHYPRRAYVLITDGYDNASAHGIGDVMRSALSPGAPIIYVLKLFDPSAGSQPDRPSFTQFLSPVRAHIVFSGEPHATREQVAEITSWIDNQYALTYTSTLNARDKRLHKIEIKMPQADKRVKVETLEGYYIPGS
jgi:hypothetical protein